ncbi:GH25 family lysozyme [Rummeliibacillus stabekisii]|uniref:GH25 family lysozyme n=1 Tax=Rummeliibacillus stabekisii TaxID=241244 RepID=UPI003714E5F1
MGKIVDISKWQPEVNYKTFATEIDLAILRVQDGSTTKDKVYQTDAAGCEQYKVPYGVYAFTRFISVGDAKVEARDFYSRATANGRKPLFFVADVEDKTMSDMKAGTNAFIAELRRLGAKKVGVYVAHHLYSEFNLDYSKADFVWIPRYANDGVSVIKPNYPCDLQQYTDKGKIAGIAGNVDLNRLNGTKTLDWFLGKEGVKAVSKPVNQGYYPKKYDRLVSLTDFGIYEDKEFKKELKRHKKDTKLDIIDIARTKNGTPRFIVCGGYCTANL